MVKLILELAVFFGFAYVGTRLYEPLKRWWRWLPHTIAVVLSIGGFVMPAEEPLSLVAVVYLTCGLGIAFGLLTSCRVD